MHIYQENKLVGMAIYFNAKGNKVSKTTCEYDDYRNITLKQIEYPN